MYVYMEDVGKRAKKFLVLKKKAGKGGRLTVGGGRV